MRTESALLAVGGAVRVPCEPRPREIERAGDEHLAGRGDRRRERSGSGDWVRMSVFGIAMDPVCDPPRVMRASNDGGRAGCRAAPRAASNRTPGGAPGRPPRARGSQRARRVLRVVRSDIRPQEPSSTSGASSGSAATSTSRRSPRPPTPPPRAPRSRLGARLIDRLCDLLRRGGTATNSGAGASASCAGGSGHGRRPLAEGRRAATISVVMTGTKPCGCAPAHAPDDG